MASALTFQGGVGQHLALQSAEPVLNLIQSGGVGGGEVEMVAGPVGQPALDAGVLVGGVVVEDEVDVEVRGHVGIDVFEEAQELLVAMARPVLGEDLAGGDVQGGEEGGGAVADVAVGHAFDVAQSQRQEGLGTLQGLELALLVDAQHQCMVGWVESWKCFCRWDWMLNAVQIRWTVDFDSPVASAMARQVQCVLPLGGGSRASSAVAS